MVQNNLGIAYSNRIQGSRAENIETAIKAFQAALTVYTAKAFPQDWANTQNNLGTALEDRIRGSRAENIEEAIKAHEAALSVFTREAFPQNWAETQSNLGTAYLNRIRGSLAENVEIAIQAYKTALTVFTRKDFPKKWAMAQTNLGTAYSDRIRGKRAESIEAAISAHEAALTVFTARAYPKDWAMTQHNVSSAYRDRIRGSRAENIEAAIKALEAALSVYTTEAFPQMWASTQHNLGSTYLDRIRGNRAENIETAIKALEAALSVFTAKAFPQKWARTQNSLGSAYSDRIRGNKAENTEAAIKAFEASLTVFTTETNPHEWAMAQNNLGLAYIHRIRGNKADNIEAAIKALEAALTVHTATAYPHEWANTQINLSVTYLYRMKGSQTEKIEASIKALEGALTVYTSVSSPRNHLRASVTLGPLFMMRKDWGRANTAYKSAIEAFQILFGEGIDKEEARNVISKAGSLFTRAAFVQVQLGDLKGALQTLSQGRAHMLAAALRQKTLKFSPKQQIRYRALLLEIREWEKLAEAKGIEGAEALRHLSKARVNLAALIRVALSKSERENDIDAIAREGHLQNTVLVAPIVTMFGSKFLFVTVENGKPSVHVIEFPKLNVAKLQALLFNTDPAGKNTGWLVDYAKQDSDRKAWLAAINGIGSKLWTLFARKLDSELKKAGIADGTRLIVLPEGALGLLPLDLARDPGSGRNFADAYEIVSVPSLGTYLASSRTIEKGLVPSLSETVNTLGDLPYTDIEGALVASYFAHRPMIRLDKANATPDVVLAGLKGKSYWHFATHGVFDWNDARQTGLVLKDRTRLTVGALLEASTRLGTPRLVVLSACETGLYDADRNPGEFVGLPAAFLQLGAGGAIASLWPVDDLATALLMARVYELHFEKNLIPSAALKQAKAWLRNATR